MPSDKSLLRFITCGSVDDGKSTLIGRLLYDCGAVADDQRAALVRDSANGELDFALLVDGLTAEREQGITIDVAYRYFSTPKRKFIVADTPGHEQYTRNMVTGASTADLALVLADARKGVLVQTRRHAFLASLMKVRQVVLVVTKMDLVGYDQTIFDSIVAEFESFAAPLGFTRITAIPVSGLKGDNVVSRGASMPWYGEPALLDLLEAAEIDVEHLQRQPLRMAVQSVNRPNQDFRGFTGRISSGAVTPGAAVRVLPSGRTGRIARIVTADGDLTHAVAGQSVTLTFDQEIDCSRGDVIVAADDPCEISDQLQSTIIWMSDTPLYPGRRYWLKCGARTLNATITDVRHRVDINTLEERPAKELSANEIGVCNLSLDAPLPFDPFDQNRDTGGFILIDQITHETVGAGLIRFALRRSQNVHWQSLDIDREAHARIKGQAPAILWFTGLSGAGKSTIANLVEKKLYSLGRHTVLLDGDNLRHGLNRDLGFTTADRVENIRRVAEVAKLMADAGLIVLVAFISPFKQERDMARAMAQPGEFFEIFVDAPMAVLEQRDPKGLYKKARAGELKNFTGVDSPYEAPEAAEITIDTMKLSPAEAAEAIVAALMAKR